MYALRRPTTLLLAAVASFPLLGGHAAALTAGTGTVNVTVTINPTHLSQSNFNINATFDDATYDLGVDLHSVAPVSAMSVALSNVNIFALNGASFDIPFSNGTDSFHAVGDIACPSGGCLAPASGPYSFVGLLQNVNVAALSPFSMDTFTFDGSVTCNAMTVSGITTLTCTGGTFVLNALTPDAVGTGAQVTIDATQTYLDPAGNPQPDLTTRVILNNVTAGGTLSVAPLSRYRGAIPAHFATTGGGFDAVYFDVSTDAVFASARVCVEVDSNLDGIVDGTTLAVNQLAILHGAVGGGAFAVVPLVVVGQFLCADVASLSPFVLLIDTSVSPPTTTTTTTPSATTTPGSTVTTTTAPGGATTTTTLGPACTTARDCLQQATAHPLCAETINPKLLKTINKDVKAATTKLGKAAAATGAKAAKFQKQARAAIVAIETQADRFVTKKKGPISSTCRDAIKQAFGPVLGAIDASEF
jgi:hypothetical protein